MLVRIQLGRQGSDAAPFRDEALAIAALLTPASLLAFAIFLWSISSDLRWTTNFFISTGPFAHWQCWLAAAATLLLVARLLNRYAQRNARNNALE